MSKEHIVPVPKGHQIDTEKSNLAEGKIIFKEIEQKVWSREMLNIDKARYYFLDRCKHNGFILDRSNDSNTFLVTTYPTEELAEKEAHIFRTMQAMRHWARWHNEIDGWKADWSDYGQKKHGIILNRSTFHTTTYRSHMCFIFQIAVSSDERAKQMLEEFKDDLQKIEW